MNKTAIKNYAIWARVQLIESAKQRAFEYEITDGGENQSTLETVGGRLLSKEEKEQRRQLIEQIRQKGYNQVMEEAAYTWFNRFIALRFMEVNGYLPSKIRVFSDENGAFKPEMLKQAMSIEIDGLDRSKVLDLIDKQDNDELFKYLLITQCNALNTGLPYMFEKIANWTELLFPANLLRNDSVIGQMISEIPEEDWTDAVQIIGWMYQYYNSELKDETFALLKKNVKITKERIPAATQLFTPDWIVRYMVENSLGRLWYEGHPDFDKSQWKYYLDEAEQEPEVERQLKKIRSEHAQIRPEEIKVIDPCMGSGHILTYAFDVLMQIYTSAGWSERDAAKSIIENNLYGLDIDDRAGQLAYFAVMMKARKYNRRILNGEVRPNVISIQESNWMTDQFITYVAGKDVNMKADLVMLRKTFKDAKEYGSILNVPAMQYSALYERIDIISKSYAEDLFQMQFRILATDYLLPLVRQSQSMSRKYDAVITNPPYMGSSGMSAKLGDFIKNNYSDSKSDLFAVFIERCGQMVKLGGYQAMITQHAWMFNTSFEKLRSKILQRDIINMIHLGARAFEEIAGEVVQTTSFVLHYLHIHNYKGIYSRLVNEGNSQKKEEIYLAKSCNSIVAQDAFENVPGCPISYWISKEMLQSFRDSSRVGDYCEGKVGLQTGDNGIFLRLWSEVDFAKISFNADLGYKWFPYNKGGSYRRWYGNNDYILNWENNGAKVKAQKGAFPRNTQYYFRKGITWSDVATGLFSMRVMNSGTAFDTCAPCLFAPSEENTLLALFNTKVAQIYMNLLSPTMHYTCGSVLDVPFNKPSSSFQGIVVECVAISKDDWDSFETSWDFKKHPLI